MTAGIELAAAFELAAAELGFAAASWLFVREVAAIEGASGVEELQGALGPSFSVLHWVCARWLEGHRPTEVDTSAVRDALEGVQRLIVVGIESLHLDALVRDLAPSTRVGLLTYRLLRVDWARVLANYGGRVEPVDVAEFQSWGGPRSALLTFVYGSRGTILNVNPSFLRVAGPDVRTQFREIVGWDVLGGAPDVYPRHLVEAQVAELSALVPFTEPAHDASRRDR